MQSIKLPSMNHLYNERTLFITGASGFVGKVMIEKMLYSIPGIKLIYILIRAAKGTSGPDRWKELEKLELFNRIRRDCPDRLSKVVAIEGDISLPDLGISKEDLGRVLDETSMVFHCAATVRFNAPLKEAVELNMRGVSRVISLCHRMPKLECFLHCSTCYVNADKQGTIVEEKLYPAPCDPHKLIEAEDWMSESLFESMGKEAAKNYGNTYCFTKCLAEHLVMEDASRLRTIIFRPSVIEREVKYQDVCLSVCLSVRPSVRPSHFYKDDLTDDRLNNYRNRLPNFRFRQSIFRLRFRQPIFRLRFR